MSHHTDPYAPAVHTAHVWLAAVGERLGTDDRRFTHRVLRAWFHTVRDRLGVNTAAHLSAQLPELMRGEFFEGWIPAEVPVRHDVGSFVEQFTRESGVPAAEAMPLAGAVTDALTTLCSPGTIDHVCAQLPVHLRCRLLGIDLGEMLSGAGVFTPPGVELVADLEARISALSEAVTVLAHGLKSLSEGESDTETGLSAANRAHHLLLAEGLAAPGVAGGQ